MFLHRCPLAIFSVAFLLRALSRTALRFAMNSNRSEEPSPAPASPAPTSKIPTRSMPWVKPPAASVNLPVSGSADNTVRQWRLPR